jgi:hypothetical protein
MITFVLLACGTRLSRAERVRSHFDFDSLTYQCLTIVKAEVGERTEHRTVDGNCAVYEVHVLASFKGGLPSGAVVRITGLDEYKKGPGIGAILDFKHPAPRIAAGDVVYLFLKPNGSTGYSKYRLVEADWTVLESGLRLVDGLWVYEFIQWFPRLDRWPPNIPKPGALAGSMGVIPKTRLIFPNARPPSVRAFEKELAGSILAMDALAKEIAAGGMTPARRLKLLHERQRKYPSQRWDFNDHIGGLLRQSPPLERWPSSRPAT